MAATPAFAAEQTVTFPVPGLYCASCPFIVESAKGSVDGVTNMTAYSDTRTALVVFDDAMTTLDAISSASAAVGYEAAVVGSDS